MSTVINRFAGEHRFLSNFWPSWLSFEGFWYPSVEHAYQAAKCGNPEHRRRCRDAHTAGEAKRIGKHALLRSDWESVKESVMRGLLVQKFDPRTPAGLELARMLVRTGEALLVEGNTWGDTYWGVCRGVGHNRLGELLMSIRSNLRNAF